MFYPYILQLHRTAHLLYTSVCFCSQMVNSPLVMTSSCISFVLKIIAQYSFHSSQSFSRQVNWSWHFPFIYNVLKSRLWNRLTVLVLNWVPGLTLCLQYKRLRWVTNQTIPNPLPLCSQGQNYQKAFFTMSLPFNLQLFIIFLIE